MNGYWYLFPSTCFKCVEFQFIGNDNLLTFGTIRKNILERTLGQWWMKLWFDWCAILLRHSTESVLNSWSPIQAKLFCMQLLQSVFLPWNIKATYNKLKTIFQFEFVSPILLDRYADVKIDIEPEQSSYQCLVVVESIHFCSTIYTTTNWMRWFMNSLYHFPCSLYIHRLACGNASVTPTRKDKSQLRLEAISAFLFYFFSCFYECVCSKLHSCSQYFCFGHLISKDGLFKTSVPTGSCPLLFVWRKKKTNSISIVGLLR